MRKLNKKALVSIVIPSYNEADGVRLAAQKISKILEKNNIHYEIIFVDDGSTDNTWQIICQISSENKNIKGISFSRNFGKESAIAAGLSSSNGDCAVVIDCDLQHPPEKIIEMYNLWRDGYDIIEGVKSSRGKEGLIYKLMSKIFYGIMSRAMKTDMTKASDFKLLDRSAINAVLSMKEKNAFFRALSSWVGFRTIEVEYDVQERKNGSSKWSKKSLIEYAITNITSFTTLPMQIVTFLGFAMLLLAILLGIIALCDYASGRAVEGFTTVIILNCFIGSVTMMSLGIVGYYISRIFDEVRDRPKYIIKASTGFSNEK